MDTTYILNNKVALPNKLLQEDGTVTDIKGDVVVNAVNEYNNKPALPNKFLNPDGTYSTLNEIIASMVDTSIFVIVDELPQTGDPQKIYLVPDGKGGFIEYHYTDGVWDAIGVVEIGPLLSSVVVNGAYDSATKEIVLTLYDGSTKRFSIADLTNELEATVTDLQKNQIEDTGEGSNITLTNCADAVISDVVIKGQTEQVSYSGKNLLNLSDFSIDISGVQITCNNGIITLNGTATADIYKQISSELNIQLTESFTMVRNSSEPTLEAPVLYVTIDGTEYNMQNQTAHRDYRTLSGGTITRIRLGIKAETTLSNVIIKPMLYTGEYDSTIEYEPYCGGIASPNPDYPQEVHVVTGENSIKVTGKNLFDKDNVDFLINKSFDAETGEIIDKGSWRIAINYYPIKENTNYILLGIIVPIAWRLTIVFYNSAKEAIQVISKTNVDNVFSFETPQNANYIRFNFANERYDLSTIQLEEGTETSSYEPYKEQTYPISLGTIELCKIGDYQDYIYNSSNKWYKHKAVGKVIYNGSETNIVLQDSRDNTYLFRIETVTIPLENYSTNYICDNFTAGTANSNTATIGSYVFNNNFRCRVPSTIATTVATFKTWLQSNNVTLYYVLETPIEEEITDVTLLSQLNAIKQSCKTYEGTTHIMLNGADLVPIAKIDCYKNTTAVINGINDSIAATRQYVDDSISASITEVLNGSY